VVDKKLKLKLLGEVKFTDYLVTKNTLDEICTKTDGTVGNIDYKLINAAKEYLKGLDDSETSNFYSEKIITVDEFINLSGFTVDSGYSCNSDKTLKLQLKGRFVTTDYVAEKENDTDIICEN